MIQRIPAERRHCADHGWLQACWLFSFDSYQDRENIHFGTLRVFNDDVIALGRGFPEHPHEEFEIVTVPLSGTLSHTDSTGARGSVSAGEVQHMTAGTGIRHAEMNAGPEPVHSYQIWFYPRERGLPPGYDQMHFAPGSWHNRLLPLVSGEGLPDTLPLHADATLYRAAWDTGHAETVETHSFRRVFIYVASGSLMVDDITLDPLDQARIHPEGARLPLEAVTDCELVVIDSGPWEA